jgi:PAS domain-containing protein
MRQPLPFAGLLAFGVAAFLATPANAQADPGFAQAAMAAMGGALVAALAGFALLSFWLRRRLWQSESVLRGLRRDADLDDAIALQRGEQELRWREGDALPVASPGFGRLVGIGAGGGDPFTAFLALFDADAAARIEAATGALRRDGTAFTLDVTTRDRRRAFALRGTVLFAAGGASCSVLSVSDRSDEQETIMRLEREAAAARYLLDELPVPVWRRGPDLRLDYVNRAYRDAVDAQAGLEAEALPELAAGVARQGGRELAIRARSTHEAQSDRYHAVTGGA